MCRKSKKWQKKQNDISNFAMFWNGKKKDMCINVGRYR